MNFEVILSRRFLKEIRSLLKKYSSLREEFEDFVSALESNPLQGTRIGMSCYKVRLGIRSKGKGKSGGSRVITYVVTEHQKVFLLTIYDKQVKDTLSTNELRSLLSDLDNE